MKNTPLLDKLIEYIQHPKRPFHMPGHVRGNALLQKIKDLWGTNVFKSDLTELDELDNLFEPTSVIKQTQNKIASIFGAKASYLLVNGSTTGLMALILSVVRQNEKIVVARNCHRSVINGIILSGANPVWLMPQWLSDWQMYGSINPRKLELCLSKNDDIKAVVLTNPTYDGVISDINEITNVCKKHNVVLIVDEAHGGHWKFNDNLPQDALSLGADAVVQSMHKTCGSLTQSSVLHLSNDSKINHKALEENLRLLQTTSPSYLLMSSLDAATSFIDSNEGRELLNKCHRQSLELRNKLKKLSSVSILDNENCISVDPTRLFLKIKGLSGHQLAEILENNCNIAIESLNNLGVLLFLNIGNTQDDFEYLYESIEIISISSYNDEIKLFKPPILPDIKISPRDAFYCDSISLPIKDSVGKINRYPIVKYPPGSCILLPGELITDYHLNFFNDNEFIEVIN